MASFAKTTLAVALALAAGCSLVTDLSGLRDGDDAGGVRPVDGAPTADGALPLDASDQTTCSTVVLRPTDTYLTLNTNKHSNEALIHLYTWPANRIANAILLKFDLSAVASSATIAKATLRLFLLETDATADATYRATVHRLLRFNPDIALADGYTHNGTNGWTANTCCYDNVPLAQSDISASYAANDVDKALGWKTWDVTLLVDEWQRELSPNYGMLVNSDPARGADRWRYFASAEAADASRRPELTIEVCGR
jgi:hypothetical protein